VVVKWLIEEPLTENALIVFEGYSRGELTVIAPDLLYAEVGNVLWKKCLFQGLGEAEAQSMLNKLDQLDLQITPASELLHESYQIAVQHRRTFYDSLYLALCQREDCPLITADEKLFNAVGASFPNLRWLGDWR
jgi:predicted nucleic acid-binding protein